MQIQKTSIAEVLIICPKRHGDERGFFSETFKLGALRSAGVAVEWVQDNHVYSAAPGVVRGLHFQTGAAAQAKLLRVSRGAILDVAVDIRSGSPTYGKHVAVELSAENWLQLYVPVGFAHGYCTITPDTEVLYKVSSEWSPEHEGGLLWDDPDLAIPWPVEPGAAILSERDRHWPRLRDFVTPF